MDDRKRLGRDVDRQVGRMKKAEKERHTLLAQTIFLGSLGLVFVLPVIAGAYLGRWLDARLAGYSVSWTISMLFAGLVIGGMNVYLLMREK